MTFKNNIRERERDRDRLVPVLASHVAAMFLSWPVYKESNVLVQLYNDCNLFSVTIMNSISLKKEKEFGTDLGKYETFAEIQ